MTRWSRRACSISAMSEADGEVRLTPVTSAPSAAPEGRIAGVPDRGGAEDRMVADMVAPVGSAAPFRHRLSRDYDGPAGIVNVVNRLPGMRTIQYVRARWFRVGGIIADHA